MPPDKNEKCQACGFFEFSLSDGFKYCDRCGTLLENFEEQEHEEGGIQQNLGQARIKITQRDPDGKKKRKKQKAPENPPKSKIVNDALEGRSNFLKNQRTRNEDIAIPIESTPDYLFRLAIRVHTFTSILAKTGHIMVKELNFEAPVQKILLATFQRYLAHCQVAFCYSEQCGNDEQLRFVALMENINYEEEVRAEKRRKKLARRGKGVKALSQSAAAWTLLTQGNITENLDLDSDADEEQVEEEVEDAEIPTVANLEISEIEEDVTVNDTTMGFVRKVSTALSKEALRRATQMILSLELLVALIHSALMSAGYRNVLISDAVRWIREDRFRISRRSIRLITRGQTELMKHGENVKTTKLDYVETYMKYPLYEIVRTSTIFHQSMKMEEMLAPQSFEKLAARIVDNLNLPIDILTRMLILESIVPCDMSPTLLNQADVKLGYTIGELSAVTPKLNWKAFLSSFGRKEHQNHQADPSDEVLLSTETRLMAYLLLSLRLTFELDEAECSEIEESPEIFDLDTWIYQFEMRIRCWQGDDMAMVLRPTCPIPDNRSEQPFGNNHGIYDSNGIPMVWRERRQIGFDKSIPPELSFNSTSPLPTVFDIRQNRFPAERRQIEAIMAPLKFQKTILRKEIDQEPEKYENIDENAEKTFFADFSNCKIMEFAESFDELFPCSRRYSLYSRPDWIQNCSARKTPLGESAGPLRFYLSNQVCEDLLGVATPSFSRRFQFLLKSLALIIGEDQKAIYAAFVMLEMHLMNSERLQNLRESILTGEPIKMECQMFRNSTFHKQVAYGVISYDPVDKIEDLKFFKLCQGFKDKDDITSDEDIIHIKDARHEEFRENLTRRHVKKQQSRIIKLCYNFEPFFSILALKFW